MKKIAFLKITTLIGFALLSPLHAEEELTPLGEEMDKTSTALKSLRRLEEGDWDAKVTAARAAQEGMIASLQYDPIIFKDMKDEAAKKLASADYRKLIAEGYAQLCELEIAYLKKDEEAAKTIIKKLKELKKHSHELYIEE